MYRKEFVPVNEDYLLPLTERWYSRVSDAFLNAYFTVMNAKGFVPDDERQTRRLLNLFVLEKAVEELKAFYEHQSEYIMIPLKALQKIRQQMEDYE